MKRLDQMGKPLWKSTLEEFQQLKQFLPLTGRFLGRLDRLQPQICFCFVTLYITIAGLGYVQTIGYPVNASFIDHSMTFHLFQAEAKRGRQGAT